MPSSSEASSMDAIADTSSSGGNDGGGGGGGAAGDNGGGDIGTLTGMAAVQGVFHFLRSPADILSASIACHRWRELACTNSVWRARFEREGLVDKAHAFEVALPAAEGGGGGSTAAEHDVASGRVGLLLYAQVYVLKVLVQHSLRERAFPPLTPVILLAAVGVQDEGRD